MRLPVTGRLRVLLTCLSCISLTACEAELGVGPEDGAERDPDRTRGNVVVLHVDVENGVVSKVPSTSAGLVPGALLGDDEIGVATSNFFRSAEGEFVKNGVRVRFDVELTNQLAGASLVTPTFPQPPLGQQGLLLIPYDITGIIGGGSVEPSDDWDGDGSEGSGGPYPFFNDTTCPGDGNQGKGNKSVGGQTSDCYRWEAFASPLGPGATSAAHTIGFDVDPDVQSFQLHVALAADLENLGAVSGIVSSPERGALAGVTVSANPGGQSATGPSGTYTILNLPPGDVTLTVGDLPDGCQDPGPRVVTVEVGLTATADFSVTCVITGVVEGTVVSPEQGPLAGVTVAALPGGQNAVTDAAGEYSILDVPIGNATLVLQGLPEGCADPGPQVVSVEPGATATADFAVSCDNTGRIVFDDLRDPIPGGMGAGREIFVMNADGSGQTQLTDDDAVNWETAWSPDRQKIAFSSERNGNRDIYVINADGTGEMRLTTDPGVDDNPDWSPDGTRIVFDSDRDTEPFSEIYVMNSDGSGLTRLTNNGVDDGSPTWSPDGSKIAFRSAQTGDSEIFVMNADGTDQTQLSDNPGTGGTTGFDTDPAWSPDGSKIAFQSNRDGNPEIYVMNADGSDETRITFEADFDGTPVWSPDGSKIAFASDRSGEQDIWVMNPDGTGLTNLMPDVGNHGTRPDW